MKLAFLRNALVQFTGVFDVIFKFTVALWQPRRHEVNSWRRIVPPGWGIRDGLAEDEFMEHDVQVFDGLSALAFTARR